MGKQTLLLLLVIIPKTWFLGTQDPLREIGWAKYERGFQISIFLPYLIRKKNLNSADFKNQQIAQENTFKKPFLPLLVALLKTTYMI